jgi:hypothetical protein
VWFPFILYNCHTQGGDLLDILPGIYSIDQVSGTMSLDYVRQIVSGHKARYVDPEGAVDLDLVYVTDRIIMYVYRTSSPFYCNTDQQHGLAGTGMGISVSKQAQRCIEVHQRQAWGKVVGMEPVGLF